MPIERLVSHKVKEDYILAYRGLSGIEDRPIPVRALSQQTSGVFFLKEVCR
jgi:hypothetical protein